MSSGITIKGLIMMATVTMGASSTNIPLPYQASITELTDTISNYKEVGDISETFYSLLNEENHIDPEYVNIVNENLWDLI
jgi:ABC-type taurine transport system substrate-binding protein